MIFAVQFQCHGFACQLIEYPSGIEKKSVTSCAVQSHCSMTPHPPSTHTHTLPHPYPPFPPSTDLHKRLDRRLEDEVDVKEERPQQWVGVGCQSWHQSRQQQVGVQRVLHHPFQPTKHSCQEWTYTRATVKTNVLTGAGYIFQQAKCICQKWTYIRATVKIHFQHLPGMDLPKGHSKNVLTAAGSTFQQDKHIGQTWTYTMATVKVFKILTAAGSFPTYQTHLPEMGLQVEQAEKTIH